MFLIKKPMRVLILGMDDTSLNYWEWLRIQWKSSLDNPDRCNLPALLQIVR